jgi:hypothetical protein
MATAYDRQLVAALPATLHPLTVYEVARPDGRTHDVYMTDADGAPVAMRLVLIKGEPGSEDIVRRALAAASAAEAARDEALAAVEARIEARLRQVTTISGGADPAPAPPYLPVPPAGPPLPVPSQGPVAGGSPVTTATLTIAHGGHL